MTIAQTHPATAPPGSAWAYSSTGYIVAGLLVEAVTGHRLGQERRERLVKPHGGSATTTASGNSSVVRS